MSFKIRYFGSYYNDDISFLVRPMITTHKCDKVNPLFYSYWSLVTKFNLKNSNHYLQDDLFLIKFPNKAIINIEDAAAKIQNLATPTNPYEAANKKYVDELIDETVQQISEENVFKRVMDNDEFKEDDDDIHKTGVENKDFHNINKKT